MFATVSGAATRSSSSVILPCVVSIRILGFKETVLPVSSGTSWYQCRCTSISSRPGISTRISGCIGSCVSPSIRNSTRTATAAASQTQCQRQCQHKPQEMFHYVYPQTLKPKKYIIKTLTPTPLPEVEGLRKTSSYSPSTSGRGGWGMRVFDLLDHRNLGHNHRINRHIAVRAEVASLDTNNGIDHIHTFDDFTKYRVTPAL